MPTIVGVAIGLAGVLAAIVIMDRLAPAPAARGWLALERRRAGLSLRRARVAGFEMPYLEGGRGEPLVLVHGFGGDKDNFTRLAAHLGSHLRLIIPDLPGFGDAGRDPTASYHIDAQVERLRGFIVGRGLDAVHLGGNSMGGFIAAQYAATYPDAVRSLWLLDAAGTALAHETAIIKHYLATGELPLLVRRVEDYDALLHAVMHRPPPLPYSLKHTLALRAVGDLALHARIFREIGLESPTLEDRLSRIRAPTLIVWGQDDRILNPAAAGALQARIARAEVDLMAATGHLPMIERPRATARAYLRFLAAPP